MRHTSGTCSCPIEGVEMTGKRTASRNCPLIVALSEMTIAQEPLRLKSRVAREFEVGEADAVDEDLIGADGGGGFESRGAAGSDVVVLVNAVAADPEAADERAVLIESDGAWKENDSTLVAVGRAGLIALRAGILHILQK